MKSLLKKIALIFGGLIIVVLTPLLLFGRGGVYPTTKHGNTSSGVYRINTEPRGACSQCHSQHASYGGASIGGPYDYALFAANTNSLCYTATGVGPCHNTSSALTIYQGSTIYNQSSHAISSSVVWPGPTPAARSMSDWGKCVNCHNPHGYKDATGLIPNMAFSREENLCLTCHDGSPARKNIYSELQKTYRHPITTYNGRHLTSENGDPTKFGTTNRHSECEDCHNPHYDKADSTSPPPPNASNRMIGVSRIKVTNGSAGTTPTYIHKAPNDTSFSYEYEICFKCHSSWTTQPSGQSNLAVFFNSNNPSYHPVEAQGKNLNINPNAFVNNWTATKLMYCVDCHSSDATTVKGPHGSQYNYILKKDYRATTSQRTMSSAELCFDCHRYDTYANPSASNTVQGYSRFNPPSFNWGHSYHVGSKQRGCYNCHESHGSTTKPALLVTGRSPGLANYNQTPTGGTCYPTCHGSKSYTMNYAR